MFPFKNNNSFSKSFFLFCFSFLFFLLLLLSTLKTITRRRILSVLLSQEVDYINFLVSLDGWIFPSLDRSEKGAWTFWNKYKAPQCYEVQWLNMLLPVHVGSLPRAPTFLFSVGWLKQFNAKLSRKTYWWDGDPRRRGKKEATRNATPSSPKPELRSCVKVEVAVLGFRP